MDRAPPSGALAAIATGLLAGAWLAVFGVRAPFAWMASVAVLGIGGLLVASTSQAAVRPSRVAWLVFAVLAAVVGQGLAPYPPAELGVPRGVARAEGIIERASGDGAVLRLSGGSTLEDEPMPAGARIFVRGLDAPPDTHLRVLARLSPRQVLHNPSPHPRWPSRPLAAVGRARSRPVVLHEAPLHRRIAHAVRGHVRSRLEETLPPDAAALGRTLLLGERHAMADEPRDAIRGAGLSHVLAVSGLHVTLLAGACVALLGLAFARLRWITARVDARRVAKLAGIPIALGYALLVSDAPSAWRAAITASLAWGLAAAGRRAHPVGVTAGAALLLAALRPDDLARPGFALSILATAAIVTEAGIQPEAIWKTGLRIATRTMIATAPIVIWLFGALPLVGLLANLVVVPLATVILLPVYAVHALLAAVAPELSAPTAPLVEVSARAFVAASEVFAMVPLGRELPPPSLLQGLAVGGLCVGWLASSKARTRLALVAVAVLVIASAEVHLRHTEQPTGQLRVTFLDVGQGDAALVDLPDGRLMVIDAGGSVGGGPDPGSRVLVPLLRARRRSRVDVFVLSHPHPDHYGGLPALLEAFEIGEIWDTGQAEAETPEGALATALRESGVRVRGPDELCGRTHRFGDARIDVRWPCPEYDPGWGPNENSLVLDLHFGSRRFLFTGDAEVHAEGNLVRQALGGVDVLKVAHHGSRTSSAAALLEMLRPRVAIVSAGAHNRYGHPHDDVWERIRGASRCALRTDVNGAAVVRTDGANLEVRPTRGRCSR